MTDLVTFILLPQDVWLTIIAKHSESWFVGLEHLSPLNISPVNMTFGPSQGFSVSLGLLAAKWYLKSNCFIHFFTVERKASLSIRQSSPLRVPIVWERISSDYPFPMSLGVFVKGNEPACALSCQTRASGSHSIGSNLYNCALHANHFDANFASFDHYMQEKIVWSKLLIFEWTKH